MGASCGTNTGEQYYKGINYEKYLNTLDMNEKYKYTNKLFVQKEYQKTILVYDMIFGIKRILKQVNLNVY